MDFPPDETQQSASLEAADSSASAPVRVPAEHYASDLSTVRPLVPRWVSFGCGGAALLVLLVVGAGGAWLMTGGGVRLLDWTFGSMQNELEPMMTKDVTPAQRVALSSEFTKFRAGLKSGAVGLVAAQPLLRSLQGDIADRKLTAAEVDELTRQLREAAGAKKSASPGK